MTFIGIDPGESGGIAALKGERVVLLTSMPDTPQVQWEMISSLVQDPEVAQWNSTCRAAIEQVTGYIPQPKGKSYRHGGQPGSRMFVFGRSYGALLMTLIASGGDEGADWIAVRPQLWQQELGIVPKEKDETREEFKRRLKEVAQGLYPQVRVTTKTADALLIATYLQVISK